MPQPAQMQFLSDLADERSEAALHKLALARQALGAAQDQLNLLTQYGSDYHTRLGREVSGGMGSDMLRNYQGFMSNVAQAIVQQNTEVARRTEACRAAESTWREAQRQVESLRTLAARERARLRVVEERRQQKTDDEFSSRMGLFGLRTNV